MVLVGRRGTPYRLMPAGYKRVAAPYIGRMTLDALSRRHRQARPQAGAGRLFLGTADLALFGALNRHGPLPTNYIAAFLQHHHSSRNYLQWKLTRLYHGAPNTPPLLARPPQQFQSFAARYQHLVYDLTDTSRAILEAHGTPIIRRTDPFLHRLMGACVGASIELASQEIGLRYIGQAEVLAKSGGTLEAKSPAGAIIPDDLFGLQYRDGSYRFFAAEIDRQTESLERAKGGLQTFAGKLARYRALLQSSAFKQSWSVPNLLVLVITTNATRMRNMINLTNQAAAIDQRFLFQVCPDFGPAWRVPDLMPHLLTGDWARAVGSFSISRP